MQLRPVSLDPASHRVLVGLRIEEGGTSIKSKVWSYCFNVILESGD